MARPVKIVFIHGNGGATAHDAWIPEVAADLRAHGLEVIAETFPDNYKSRASHWLPHIEALGADEQTILIGHSSGALAAMRYAQTHDILGSVLIGAAHTDLGDANEKASGYFDQPWQWDAIREHQQWIIQFASTDDPYIPVDEQEFVRDNLHTQYHQFHKRGHFLNNSFPELTQAILEKTQA